MHLSLTFLGSAQASCDEEVASGTQVVLHEVGDRAGVAAGLDGRSITHTTRRVL